MADKKHFYFPDFGEAYQAMEAWWARQDAQGASRTSFNVSASGQDTNVSVSDSSLPDQTAFAAFLQKNFAGKFTTHDTQQVRTWLDDVFASKP